jgi:hypothetical protein
LGKWHLDIARPGAEKDAWLSARSWCRSATLPRTLELEVRARDGGGVTLTGSPVSPSDLLVRAGKCTFEFSNGNGGIPQNHELTVEIGVQGTKVDGTVHCAEKTPGQNHTSTAVAIDTAVTGSVIREQAASPVDASDLVADVKRACVRRDADAIWNMATSRFQSEADERAAQVRTAVPRSDLRRLYGFRGEPRAFTGLPLLRSSLRSTTSTDNPCTGAAGWAIEAPSKQGQQPSEQRSVAVRRPDGAVFGMTFVRAYNAWKLDKLSKPVVPKP